MTLLSSLGKALLKGGKAIVKAVSTKEAQTALSLTPIGAVGKVDDVARVASKAPSLAKSVLTGAGKVAKFLFVGETPVQSVKKIAQTTALAGVVAGGGLKLIPEAFKGVKKATQKTVDFIVPATPLFPEVSVPGYQSGLISKEKAPVKDILETGGALLGSAAIGAAVGLGIENYFKNKNPPALPAIPSSSDSAFPSAPAAAAVPAVPSSSLPAAVPITPQTQVIGKPAGSLAKRKKKSKKSSESPRITLRNQNINIVGRYADY